jgi:hypothetical protein
MTTRKINVQYVVGPGHRLVQEPAAARAGGRRHRHVVRPVLRRQPVRPEQEGQRRVRVREVAPEDGGVLPGLAPGGAGGVPGRERAVGVRQAQAQALVAARRDGAVRGHGLPRRLLPRRQRLPQGVHLPRQLRSRPAPEAGASSGPPPQVEAVQGKQYRAQGLTRAARRLRVGGLASGRGSARPEISSLFRYSDFFLSP